MWISFRKSKIGGRFVLGILLFYFLVVGLSRSAQKSDFLDYFHASQRWTTGDNLYKFDVAYKLSQRVKSWEELFLPENMALLNALTSQTATYIYPPLFSFLILPLTTLPQNVAAGLHSFINFAALIGILYLLFYTNQFQINSKNIEWLLVIVILANLRYIENHIQNNQVGILLVFIVLLALTTKNDLAAGILLALATSIKVTPIVFLAVFFYEKRFKAFYWFGISMIFWNALPMLYNADYTIEMTKTWVKEILGNALSNPLLRSWKNNQSLPSTLSKYFISGADFVNQPLYRMPYLDLSLGTVKVIQLIIITLFGAPLLLLMRIKDRKWELTALLFLASALFSGISWIHSFVICLFPYYLVFSKYLNDGFSKKQQYTLLLIISLVLLSHRSVVGKIMESIFLMFSLLFYLNAALYVFILRYSLKNHENRN